MPSSLSPSRFSLTIKGFNDDLQVFSFSGTEAISTPYAFELVLVSERAFLDLESLLHQPAFLAFDSAGTGIHGQIYAIAQGQTSQRLTFYTLTLVPQLAYLKHRHNQRIFQKRTVEQIIGQLLEEHGIFSDSYAFKLDTTYKARDYCVQYQESDLHFIQRLCEEEGIHYHFEHSAHGHRLVFGDGQVAFQKLPASVPYHTDSGLVAAAPAVNCFEVQLNTRTTRSTLRDYNFETASREVVAAYGPAPSTPEPDLEDYVYPGHFNHAQRGKLLSQRALERQRADRRQAVGKSDQCALSSGHFMPLSEHPYDEWNALWLLTEVSHQGRQPQVLEEHAADPGPAPEDGFSQGYRNHFVATPWEVFYRPPLAHKKPRVLGVQTARVTGPVNEEVHCDQYGRVKVQFHWDREGQHDDNSSCWLRVASSWAGDSYGAVTIPRVGMEVLVRYLEGDVDQPVISGCLVSSMTPTPLKLPADKTQSTLRSRSTPGGGGYNELRLEDRQGQEKIYLHAQRDMQQHIENDSRLQIDGQREETISGTSVVVLKGEDQQTVSGDRKVQVQGNDFQAVAMTSHTRVGLVMAVEAGVHAHFKAGATLVVDGGPLLTLMAGGQHLQRTPVGIYSSSPILPGGVPIPGMPAVPASTEGVEAMTALALESQKRAFASASANRAPLCLACESLQEGQA